MLAACFWPFVSRLAAPRRKRLDQVVMQHFPSKVRFCRNENLHRQHFPSHNSTEAQQPGEQLKNAGAEAAPPLAQAPPQVQPPPPDRWPVSLSADEAVYSRLTV